MAGWGERIQKRGDELTTRALAVTKHVARAVLQEAVERTPVDTGRARSNWAVTVGVSPLNVWHEPPFPGKRGSTVRANSQYAFSNATTALQGRMLTFAPIYISNFTPYIEQLDSGTGSRQAPDGMSLFAMQAGRRVLTFVGPLLKGP